MSQFTINSTRALMLVAAIVIGSFGLLVSVALPEGNRTYAAIQNFGHFVLFACLGCILLPIVNGLLRDRMVAAVVVTGIGLMVLGIAVELFQTGLANRNASISDFILDVAGIVVGFAVVLVSRFFMQRRKSLGILAIGVVVLLTAFALKPLIPLVGFDFLRADIPVIRNFDHLFAGQKIEAVGGATYVQLNQQEQSKCCALRVTFKPARYSGIAFEENAGARKGRWSDFETLNIKVFSSLPNTRQIALRINDRLHNNQYQDRYNTRLSISPGLNEVRLPLQMIARMGREEATGRTMDVDDISYIQIFASEVEKQFTLDVLSIELE